MMRWLKKFKNIALSKVKEGAKEKQKFLTKLLQPRYKKKLKNKKRKRKKKAKEYKNLIH